MNTLPTSTRTPEAGFSMLELLVATAVTMGVLGATAVLANQVQARYRSELDTASVRAEAQFALDWILRDLRGAGSDPYSVGVSGCPVAGTEFTPILRDPNGNGVEDDVRIHADVNPPNGLLGGAAGACNEPDEVVTIAHDPVQRVITRRDHNAGNTAVPMTDDVITGLAFTYLDAAQAPTTSGQAISFIGVAITAETRRPDPTAGRPVTVTVRDQVRVRMR